MVKDWERELGFEVLAVQVEGPSLLWANPPLSEVPGSGSEEYVRPHTFTLWGTQDEDAAYNEWSKWGWEKLGQAKTVELRGGEALNNKVDICAEADELCEVWGDAASVVFHNPATLGKVNLMDFTIQNDALILESLRLKSEFQDWRLARHFFTRVLAFHGLSHLGCVLAPLDSSLFHEIDCDAELPETVRKLGDFKLRKMLEGWDFKPILGSSEFLVLVLDDTAYELWLEQCENGSPSPPLPRPSLTILEGGRPSSSEEP